MTANVLRRSRERFQFALERLFVRGTQYRFLVMAVLIGLVALGAGIIVFAIDEGFGSFGEAVWWAFLRLTDPGYLGDDEGLARRTISTVVTVLGYVLFVGAIVAILTQWLNQRIRSLESGLTPIAQKNHIVILGWTNRTATIVQELLLSEGRVRRFLERHGARRMHIVILVEDLALDLVEDLRERLGPLWDEGRIVLRSGTPLRMEHLDRVDFGNAAAIVIPGGEFGSGGSSAADTRTIKTLLSIASHSSLRGRMPLVVAEVFDTNKVAVARTAYAGPIEILPSDAVMARLIAQNLRHPGLSRVYTEILSHAVGSEIYVRECPHLAGVALSAALGDFPRAIPLGVIRQDDASERPLLNPPPTFTIENGDRIVFLAATFEDTEPVRGHRAVPEAVAVALRPPPAAPITRRILVLGWSHKVVALLRELESYDGESFEVDLFSARPADERSKAIHDSGLELRRLALQHLEGDYTTPVGLRAVDLSRYDNVVFLASDWLDTGEESDARTILGSLLLRQRLPAEGRPQILLELVDPENVPLFGGQSGEVLISPVILSHMLAQVALRRDLRIVFDELFGPGGAEIYFRSVEGFGLAGPTTFEEIRRAAFARREIALGIRVSASGEVVLNPARDRTWSLVRGDEVIVLA